MEKLKRPNIIWVVTDSARNFSTGGLDDRDRPDFFDTISDEFVNFENTVTSAPSSVMSGACMLTGMNSYYIGRNYDDFRYEEGVFPNLATILSHHDYETQSIFVAREMREKIAPFIGHVKKDFWPKNISHSQRMWKNETANDVLENYLVKRESEKPLFLMLWNNIRHDLNISNNLNTLVKSLKKHGYYDNSVIIFCADHGSPHPRRGFTPESLKREGLTHDLMLGDDNILIPLLLKAPGCMPSNVKDQVGTIDLFPTILDYAGIDSYSGKDSFPQSGFSLRPLLDQSGNKEVFNGRSIRCDCRFFGQSQRKTAIRQGQFKYVYSHDDSLEEFYDIGFDPLEDLSLAEKEEYREKMSELRDIFLAEELKANEFQEKYIAKKLVSTLSSNGITGQLIIFSLQGSQMNDRLISAVANAKSFEIKAFVGTASEKSNFAHDINSLTSQQFIELKKLVADGAQAILLYAEVGNEFDNTIKFIKDNGITLTQKFDINFQSTGDVKWTLAKIVRAISSRRKLIQSEPSLLLTYAKEFIQRIFRKLR